MLRALALLLLAADTSSRDSAKAVYSEVRGALEAKSLRLRTTPDCDSEFSSFTLGEDSRGVVRYFVRDLGSSDASEHIEAYYDAQARLRFVFVKVGAVPSAWVEARYWLDEAGHLADQKRTTGGEGPTYYAQDPKPYLVKNPRAYAAAHSKCQ